MCGIAGIASPSGLRELDPILLDRMLRAISHRGPDDQFTAGEPGLSLGARRLSIIDLEGGRQPLADESGLILATQNGEIYNYIELREDLERRGHAFQTRATPRRSCTCTRSTARPSYSTCGACSPSPSGTAAPIAWCVADRLGKKPLYWRLANGRLTYGSELKAILQDPESSGSSIGALDLYLQHLYVPAPWTILRGVAKLPPASLLSGMATNRRSNATGRRATSPSPVGVRGGRGGGSGDHSRRGSASSSKRRPGRGLPEWGHGLERGHGADGRESASLCARSRSASRTSSTSSVCTGGRHDTRPCTPRRSFVSTRSSCCPTLPTISMSPSRTRRPCRLSGSRRSPRHISRWSLPVMEVTSPLAGTGDT